jgi:hypothetical protein
VPACGWALAAISLLLPAQAFAPGETSAPVAAKVLEEMARQPESTYWVILSEQSDLSSARGIARWPERGRHVHDALTRVAARSQRGLLAYLRARGLRHQSFWIVNAIQVTSGAADLDRIRRRKEVKEIRADWVYSIPTPPCCPPRSRSAWGSPSGR